MSTELLVVGSVAFDTIHTPTGSAEEALGGSATYFSIAASNFAKPSLVAVVGTDFGEEHLSVIREHTTDMKGLEVCEGETFRWGGRYLPDMAGRETLFTHLNVFESFEPKVPEDYRKAKTLFLANIDPVLQKQVLETVTDADFVACDTMNFWIEGPRRQAVMELLPHLDCLIINDEEAALLTGLNNPVEAGPEVQKLGPKTVIIKKGPHGLLLFHENEIFALPAVPLTSVIDPTGAGDSFAGGFMGYLTSMGRFDQQALREAAVVGTLLASFCVQGFGVDRLRGMTRSDLLEQYSAFKRITGFPELPLAES